jgi:hypothetical protein
VAAGHLSATRLLVLGSVCAAVALGGPAQAAPGRTTGAARMTLVRTDPATVHGTAFRRHERIRVVLRRPGRPASVRDLVASARGSFSVTFGRAAVDRCSGFSITARGGFGSRAVVRRVPRALCPPA